jgi:hypothetical protein
MIKLFPFQAGKTSLSSFIPVIETQVEEGDEVFISDYPMKILTNGDLQLVPWMVGITSKEGGLFPPCKTTGLKQKVVRLERGPLSLVNTTEELLNRKVAAPV